MLSYCFLVQVFPVPGLGTTSTVSGEVTVDGYTADTFGPEEQLAFGSAMATLSNVSVDDVTVTVEDARRRRLLAGVSIKFEITVDNDDTISDAKARIEA